ncbi:hypothetical protein [Vibrio sp. 10N.239.312.D08]|uniref:hypothetical protein n=1 Tax=Vibrio sp. 10N.239.312.D08 TaxID=3229978 RepID=UPI00354D829F
MRLAIPIISLSFLVGSQAVAAECMYGDQVVPVGQEIAILDPFLVNEATQYYMDKGYSKESAKKIATNSDWTVIVLECQVQYHYQVPQSNEKAAAMLMQGKPALIPVDHQRKFVEVLLTDS